MKKNLEKLALRIFFKQSRYYIFIIMHVDNHNSLQFNNVNILTANIMYICIINYQFIYVCTLYICTHKKYMATFKRNQKINIKQDI